MEDHNQRIFPTRRRRSRNEALRLATEFEQSGLSRRAFCQQHGLSPASLDSYRKLYRRETGADASTVPDFMLVPVEVIDQPASSQPCVPDAGLYLVLPYGRRLAITSGFDASTLTRLLACARCIQLGVSIAAPPVRIVKARSGYGNSSHHHQ